MRAIRLTEIGEPENLQLVDEPEPFPGPGEICLRVQAAGVNYADVLIRRGLYQPMPALPMIPGMESAGTVVSVGEGVECPVPGDRVAALTAVGGYAQYARAYAAAAVRLPADLDFDAACGLPVSGMTAYHLTHTVAPLEPGMVAVNYAAAGAVGGMINGLAKMRGATVIALAGSSAKLARARELGADHAFNYRSETDIPARVKELTGNRGADIIYNSVFGPTVGDDLRMLAPRGHVVWYGVAGGLPNTKHLLAGLLRRFVDAPTFTLYHLMASARYDIVRHLAGWQEMFGYLRAGKVRLSLQGVYPLAEAPRAHRELESRATMGKLVLHPWDD